MEIQCPTCSARFKVPDTVSVATCPYCGTTFHVHTGKEAEEEHYFFSPMKEDPAGKLLKFLSRQYGAPADITGARVTKKELHWVPVHFFYAHGRYRRWETIEEVFFEGVPAGSPLASLLDGYPFPVRGKRFFDQSIVGKGEYYEPELLKEDAEKRVYEHLISALRSEALEEDKPFESGDEVEYEIKYQGLVHYPVWEVAYEYNGEEFRDNYVDGSDGRVIKAEYPLMSEARKKATVLGAGLLGTGLILGVIAAGLYGSVWGILGGLASAGAGAYGIFRKGTVKRRTVSEVDFSRRGNIYFKPI